MEKNSSKDRGTVLWRFSQEFQFAADKIIPDSLVFCLILTFIVYVAALIFTDRGPVQLCLDRYNHAWDMLAFSIRSFAVCKSTTSYNVHSFPAASAFTAKPAPIIPVPIKAILLMLHIPPYKNILLSLKDCLYFIYCKNHASFYMEQLTQMTKLCIFKHAPKNAENPRGCHLWGFLFSLGTFSIFLQRHYIICIIKLQYVFLHNAVYFSSFDPFLF